MPEWLGEKEVLYFHRMLIDEHGGSYGILNQGALESTLTRPINLHAYKPEASFHQLAASYGFGFAKNHVFVDGNKRVSLTVTDVFLRINGWQLIAEEIEAVYVIRDLAAGVLDENELATWIEKNSARFDLDAS